MNLKATVDYSLYLVTDRELAGNRSVIQVVETAIRGGVNIVQYREKSASTRQMIAEAQSLLDICHRYAVPLIINDRVDVALAIDADGVHVGQEDMPAELVRKILGSDKIIGVSVESTAQVETAVAAGADYVASSPVYTTATKPDAVHALGISGVKTLAQASPLPLIAIGGLNAANCAEVVRAGADSIAVVSAIMAADNPEEAARLLSRLIRENRTKK